MPPLRIATANLENLDDHPEDEPPLTVRLPYLKAGLNRLRADIVCLQEIHGQDLPGGGRELTALDRVLEGTPYERFERASTETADGIPYRQRNLVVLSRFPIRAHQQIKHRFAPPPLYRQVTAQPEQPEAKRVEWERPILHCEIELDPHRVLHVIVVHLKSRMPSPIEGQGPERFMWKSAAGWAEGYFISKCPSFELRAVERCRRRRALITVWSTQHGSPCSMPLRSGMEKEAHTAHAPILGVRPVAGVDSRPRRTRVRSTDASVSRIPRRAT